MHKKIIESSSNQMKKKVPPKGEAPPRLGQVFVLFPIRPAVHTEVPTIKTVFHMLKVKGSKGARAPKS
jgi:hypothetical protein